MDVVRNVVGELDLTSPVNVNRVDLVVLSVEARIGYLLAIGRVGRPTIVRSVVGEFDWKSIPSAGVDGVDLGVTVGSVRAMVGYLLAIGRVVGTGVARSVAGEF